MKLDILLIMHMCEYPHYAQMHILNSSVAD